jgi:hypothetical protein
VNITITVFTEPAVSGNFNQQRRTPPVRQLRRYLVQPRAEHREFRWCLGVDIAVAHITLRPLRTRSAFIFVCCNVIR